jgi:drug/metabolite transporter (DMT)-like permease
MGRAEVHRTDSKTAAWVVLVVGVGAASTSAIFTRYADGAEPLAVSFWRCAAGALILAPFAARKVLGLRGDDLRASLLSGVFLAVHFAAWITSLYLTTVAPAVLLVSTTPVFVAVAAKLMWNDQLTRSGWIGIALTLGGSALIAGVDFGGSSLIGNLLALVGGAAGAGYALAGQVARRSVGILEYSVATYGVAAILLGIGALIYGSPFAGYDRVTWQAIVALIVVTQLIGHTLINSSLKELHATTVTVAIMAEPVIATSLAYWLFDEVPTALMIPGSAAILAGIYLVSAGLARESVVPE